MQTVYVVGSISHAMRAKRLLEQKGIRSFIRRAEPDRQNGCGYGLIVAGHEEVVLPTLKAGGVAVLRVQGRGAT